MRKRRPSGSELGVMILMTVSVARFLSFLFFFSLSLSLSLSPLRRGADPGRRWLAGGGSAPRVGVWRRAGGTRPTAVNPERVPQRRRLLPSSKMRSNALRERASERSWRSRTMPAIDSRIAAAMINGPYMAAAPSRGSSFVGSPRNIAHAASGVNRARAPSGAGGPGRGRVSLGP